MEHYSKLYTLKMRDGIDVDGDVLTIEQREYRQHYEASLVSVLPKVCYNTNTAEILEYAIAEGDYRVGDCLEFIVRFDNDAEYWLFEWADDLKEPLSDQDQKYAYYFCYEITNITAPIHKV